jgi:D-alanine-D-alanine ligase-like ATP-grasp enzyme
VNDVFKDALVEKPIDGKHVSCFIFSHKGLLHAHVFSEEKLDREEFLFIRNEALYVHNVLAFDHHVKYDFVLDSKKRLFLLEANTHPSLLHNEIDDIFKKGQISLSEYLLEKIK